MIHIFYRSKIKFAARAAMHAGQKAVGQYPRQEMIVSRAIYKEFGKRATKVSPPETRGVNLYPGPYAVTVRISPVLKPHEWELVTWDDKERFAKLFP